MLKNRGMVNPHAVALGRLGGKARLERMTAEERSNIARRAAHARAKKLTKKESEESARKAADARWEKTRKIVKEINQRSRKLLKAAEASARKEKAHQGKSRPHDENIFVSSRQS